MGRGSLLHRSPLQGLAQGPASHPGPRLLPGLGREGDGTQTCTLYQRRDSARGARTQDPEPRNLREMVGSPDSSQELGCSF